MKGEKELHKLQAAQLQRQMDADMVEMIESEVNDGVQMHRPAFEGGDVFKDISARQQDKFARDRAYEREKQEAFIQPDAENVIVVMPND